jgi:hypothetical protein
MRCVGDEKYYLVHVDASRTIFLPQWMTSTEAASYQEVPVPRIKWAALQELCSLIEIVSARLSAEQNSLGNKHEGKECEAASVVQHNAEAAAGERGSKSNDVPD